jgi:heat shock protein HtpX
MSPVSTFYQQEAHNRRESILLVVVVTAILAVFGLTMGYAIGGTSSSAFLFLLAAMFAAVLLSSASYYNGDRMVLLASQAHEVTPEQAPQLHDVVRELTIAADIPMPRLFVIDDTAPNAFATGRDPQHSSVAVTTGLLQKLDREELQGVIGHELSHVRNYDIRYMLLVGVLVGSVALLADFFVRFTFWGGGRSSSREGGGGAQALFYLLTLILAILAPIASALVQMAVSRQREYLADASSVELTRNPYGLERALAKIATDREVLEAANRATQHLYIVNPIKKFEHRASGLFSTHPPILDRINRLRSLTGQPPLEPGEVPQLVGLD